MCARYALFQKILEGFHGEADIPVMPGGQPRFNIAATDPVLTLVEREGMRQIWPMRWGLVPAWVKDFSSAPPLINARFETVAEKPSFRAAIKYRRCLIPADGFYEWTGPKGHKQPYFIHRKDGKRLWFAGIWETWEGGGEAYLESCAILTEPSKGVVSELHDRMPVVVERADFGKWLDRSVTDVRAIQGLLRGSGGSVLDAYPVSRRVNRVGVEGPELIERVELVSDSLFD